MTIDDPVLAFKGRLRPARPARRRSARRCATTWTHEADQQSCHADGQSHQQSRRRQQRRHRHAHRQPRRRTRDSDFTRALGWNPAAQDHNTALANSGGVIGHDSSANTPAGRRARGCAARRYTTSCDPTAPGERQRRADERAGRSAEIPLGCRVADVHRGERHRRQHRAERGNYLATFTRAQLRRPRAIRFHRHRQRRALVDANVRACRDGIRPPARSQVERRWRAEPLGFQHAELAAKRRGGDVLRGRHCDVRRQRIEVARDRRARHAGGAVVRPCGRERQLHVHRFGRTRHQQRERFHQTRQRHAHGELRP